MEKQPGDHDLIPLPDDVAVWMLNVAKQANLLLEIANSDPVDHITETSIALLEAYRQKLRFAPKLTQPEKIKLKRDDSHE